MTRIETIQLKPCPLCPDGGKVTLEKYTNPHSYTDSEGNTFWRDEPDGWVIECKNHGWSKDAKGVDVAGDVALYSWGTSEENKRALIEAWNTRAERTCKNVFLNRGYGFTCSECGGWDEEPNDYGNSVYFSEWEFCPHCGAKVVSE